MASQKCHSQLKSGGWPCVGQQQWQGLHCFDVTCDGLESKGWWEMEGGVSVNSRQLRASQHNKLQLHLNVTSVYNNSNVRLRQTTVGLNRKWACGLYLFYPRKLHSA